MPIRVAPKIKPEWVDFSLGLVIFRVRKGKGLWGNGIYQIASAEV